MPEPPAVPELPAPPARAHLTARRPVELRLVSFGRRYGWRDRPYMNTWLDVEGLARAYQDDTAHACSGQSGAVQFQVATSIGFLQAVADAKAQILHYLEAAPAGQVATVGFRCRSGRHRSVAMVCMLERILNELGVAVVSEHLDQRGPGKRPSCGCPDNCANFRGLSVDEQRAQAASDLEDHRAALTIAKRAWAHA